jgi:hypothetical protein
MPSLDARWAKLLAEGRAEWAQGLWLRDWDEPVVVRDDDGWPCWFDSSGSDSWERHGEDITIQWEHPATLGALLGLVRERWGVPSAYLIRDRPGWRMWVHGMEAECIRLRIAPTQGSTEAEALIAALEAAP